jgi:hypothetical protein
MMGVLCYGRRPVGAVAVMERIGVLRVPKVSLYSHREPSTVLA